MREQVTRAVRSALPSRRSTTRALAARVDELEQENARLRKRRAHLRKRLKSFESATWDTSAVAEVPGKTRLEVRREAVLASTAPQPRILEIGPAHNAILPKRDGYDSRSVDYLDREGLIQRYKDFPQYSPDDIEDVDYVLPPGAPMSSIIPDRFDLVLASHVIEHTTSMIDFLNECGRLLAPGGVLALVVPDHRYCFDRFRERASISRVIDAMHTQPKVHTEGAVVEERLNASRHRGTTAWLPGHRGKYAFMHTVPAVRGAGDEAARGERYIDTHNWICSPHHLRLLLQDLADLGYISLREVDFRDTVRHEFFINLSEGGAGSGLSREQLVRLSDDERRTLDSIEFEEEA